MLFGHWLNQKDIPDPYKKSDEAFAEVYNESEISQLYTKEHPTYKALMEKRKTLQEEKAKLNKKVSTMPETQQEILRLSRDVESGRAVYMQLLNRQQELSIAKSSAIGNVRTIAGLEFISRGMIPPNPAELLMHQRMGEFLNWANEHYDMVILDTPPILAVTDAAVIGNYAGTTLLVARFELNTTKEMTIAFKRFDINYYCIISIASLYL